jgi:hypothetical protein
VVLKTLPNVDIYAGTKFNNQASNKPNEIRVMGLDQKMWEGEMPATKFHSRKVHEKRKIKNAICSVTGHISLDLWGHLGVNYVSKTFRCEVLVFVPKAQNTTKGHKLLRELPSRLAPSNISIKRRQDSSRAIEKALPGLPESARLLFKNLKASQCCF